MKKTLREIPSFDRPRERLEKFGVSALSDYELLALLLRSGGRDLNALDLAQNLLAEFGNLSKLLNADFTQLCKFKYMGAAKVSVLQAAGELSKRNLMFDNYGKRKICSPLQAYNLVKPYILGKNKEFLYLISLGLDKSLIKLSLLSIGTVNQSLIETRDVLRTALLKDAASFILVHNHPSGTLDPSPEDIQVTREIARASVYTGINFTDHLIVTEKSYFSFKLAGLLTLQSKGGEKIEKNQEK